MANYEPKTLRVVKGEDTYDYDLGNVHYGICNSDAAEQVKTVSIPEIEHLNEGLCVRVKFNSNQGYNGIPKLQVNDLPAVNIARSGSTTVGIDAWKAGSIIDFIYDGNVFMLISGVAGGGGGGGGVSLQYNADDKLLVIEYL